MSLSEPHSEFLELCAVSTSGQLTEEEQKKLQEHLVGCESCRETLKQYETVVDQAIPAIAASEASEHPAHAEPDSSWSDERAETAFFKRLELEQGAKPNHSNRTIDISPSPHRLPAFSSESTWRHVWMLYAAGILLFVTLSFYAYRVGIHRGANSANVVALPPATLNQPQLEAQLSDAGHERQVARAYRLQLVLRIDIRCGPGYVCPEFLSLRVVLGDNVIVLSIADSFWRLLFCR